MIQIPRKFLLQFVGFIMIATGMSAAVIAPLEFSLFKDITSELEGFGYLGFAVQSVQIFGYYLMALVLVPLGYGHLLLRSWAHKLSLTALWAWFILGIPCLAFVFTIFAAYKDPSELGMLVFGVFTLLIYPILPLILVWFYRNSETQVLFPRPTASPNWIEKTPQPVLIMGSVMVLYVFASHLPLFLNGVIPFGCGFLTGLKGYALAATAILSLSLVAWGLFNRRRWAWFGGISCFTGMAANFALAFLCAGSTEFFQYLGVSDLDGSLIELQFPSVMITMLLVLPTVSALFTMLFSRKHFDQTATKGEFAVGVMAVVMLILLWVVV